ncbi:unnamed protein product [Aphanomyces euteiches]
MPECVFKNCANPAEPSSVKCADHKSRSLCTVPGCENQCYARGLCIRHGAKNICMSSDCATASRSYGFCYRHRQDKPVQSATTQCQASPDCLYRPTDPSGVCSWHMALPPGESHDDTDELLTEVLYCIICDLGQDVDQEEKLSAQDAIYSTPCDPKTFSRGLSHVAASSCNAVVSDV